MPWPKLTDSEAKDLLEVVILHLEAIQDLLQPVLETWIEPEGLEEIREGEKPMTLEIDVADTAEWVSKVAIPEVVWVLRGVVGEE